MLIDIPIDIINKPCNYYYVTSTKQHVSVARGEVRRSVTLQKTQARCQTGFRNYALRITRYALKSEAQSRSLCISRTNKSIKENIYE